jgi:hypothetical protein
MNKEEGSTNIVMADNEKEKAEASAYGGGGGSSMAIHLPNCKANIEGHGEAPVLLPVGPMPSLYSPSQPQGSKVSSQITGAKKRKSVISSFHEQ